MNNSSIPIVIFHSGIQDYFINCVNLNSLKNKVYVIGDESNTNIFNNNKNVIHIHKSTLHFDQINLFINSFINYSTNNSHLEMICFIRVFYIKKLMELENIDRICHLDSDCVLLGKIDEVFKHINTNAYLITNETYLENKNISNSGSIHTSLLNIDFCEKFIQLCLDIYHNKNKFYLIEPKINYFQTNNLPGGVCDMTLYYLLYSEKIVDVYNLLDVHVINYENCLCDDNINDCKGHCFKMRNNFKMKHGKKELIYKNNKIYIEDSDGDNIRMLTLHFQGGAKYMLTDRNMYNIMQKTIQDTT